MVNATASPAIKSNCSAHTSGQGGEGTQFGASWGCPPLLLRLGASGWVLPQSTDAHDDMTRQAASLRLPMLPARTPRYSRIL
jgi:hypothetical protein